MDTRLPLRMILLIAAGFVAACKGSPDDTPWCSAAEPPITPATQPLTYYHDVKPILDSKCIRCHTQGGAAPTSLETHGDAFAQRDAIRALVAARTMPPFLAARCCTDYFQDFSLTEGEIETILGWADQGGAGGDPADVGPALPPIGGLSRIDLTLSMSDAYTPNPPPNTTDDLRCFVIDWPLQKEVYVTGLNPVPGNRRIVHHLIVGLVGPADADDVVSRDEDDPLPGFDCTGGIGDIRDLSALGGSLLGGDFPRGIGKLVEPGSKVVLQVHYSTAHAPPGSDQTKVEIRYDDTAREVKGIAIANPLWIAGGAMSIPAGEKDAVFFFRFAPTLFTGAKPIDIQSVIPHMHTFGSKLVVRIIRSDDTRDCLLEIPRWDFGWEQPYWLAQPKRLNPGDDLYLECHFDNSAANQPPGQKPRDIAWGGDYQDMCAAFLSFSEAN